MEDERDPNNLTPEERALIESGAEPDLPSGMPPLAVLCKARRCSYSRATRTMLKAPPWATSSSRATAGSS